MLAVSSRVALRAKVAAGQMAGGEDGSAGYSGIGLGRNKEWQSSGFAEFEEFIYSFLIGSGKQLVMCEAIDFTGYFHSSLPGQLTGQLASGQLAIFRYPVVCPQVSARMVKRALA